MTSAKETSLLTSPVLRPGEEREAFHDLTSSMRNFPFRQGFLRNIGMTAEQMNWSLRKLHLKRDDACFFIILSSCRLPQERTQVFFDQRSHLIEASQATVLMALTNEEGEPERSFQLATLTAEDWAFGTTRYHLLSRQNIPLWDAAGQAYLFAPRYPSFVNAGRGSSQKPIIELIVTTQETSIQGVTRERIRFSSFIPPFGIEIWNHLREKGILDLLDR